jgi:hypothetical protein
MVKNRIYLIPLLILLVTVIYEIYTVVTTDIIFGNKHYLGFLLLTISAVAFFFRKDIGIYFTGITLILGTLNFVGFTPAIESYSFGFGLNNTSTTSFRVQLFSFLVLILHVVLNGKFLINEFGKKAENKKTI